MGRKSKTKGKRGELEASAKLGAVLGTNVTRSQQYKGNHDAADLSGTGRLAVEVKRVERLDLYGAMAQASVAAGDNLPLLLHRRNRHPWVAICYLDDLVDVAAEIQRIRQK